MAPLYKRRDISKATSHLSETIFNSIQFNSIRFNSKERRGRQDSRFVHLIEFCQRNPAGCQSAGRQNLFHLRHVVLQLLTQSKRPVSIRSDQMTSAKQSKANKAKEFKRERER